MDAHFFRTHLRDMVYGSFDGVVTTFAVVAGVQGAGLPASVILVLGAANLVADGISMALGNFSGTTAEKEAAAKTPASALAVSGSNPTSAALMTFAAFVLAGIVPLFPFILGAEAAWTISIWATGCTFFTIGALKSVFSLVPWWRAGLGTTLIGGIAAGAAYIAGSVVGQFV